MKQLVLISSWWLAASLAGAAETAAPPPARPPFFAFQNCLPLPPAELAAALKDFGYDGLSASGDHLAPFWNQLIQTLDRGSYDVGAFLRQLREIGYTGPVVLQCYNVKGDPKENLQRSMAAWRKLSNPASPAGNK